MIRILACFVGVAIWGVVVAFRLLVWAVAIVVAGLILLARATQKSALRSPVGASGGRVSAR